MSDITFDPIDLMTKSELAGELIGRAGKALVIIEEDGTGHFRCFQNFFEGERGTPSGLLRALAEGFEGSEYHPDGDDGTSERGR